jgi:hypothetical protein
MRTFCFTLPAGIFTVISLLGSAPLSAQSASDMWQGTWKNMGDKYTQILQTVVKGDSLFSTWYTNDNWRLYKVELKGKISRNGKKVKGRYHYTDRSENGTFEWEFLEFKKKHPQYTAGLRYYFWGQLGTDQSNMRNWNAAKVANDTSAAEVKIFIDVFNKERPAVYTKAEAIRRVKSANLLSRYKEYPADPAILTPEVTDLVSSCENGRLLFKGPNRYVIGDFYFYVKDGEHLCAVYLSTGSKVIEGILEKREKNAQGVETSEYKMAGYIDNIFVYKLIVTGRKAYLSLTGDGLSCTLEN